MMCILSVYATQTLRIKEDKNAFRSNLKEIIGHVEPETVLVVAGDTNAHVGKIQNSEETVGKNIWGSINIEGQDLVEMLARNQLPVVNSFFHATYLYPISVIFWFGTDDSNTKADNTSERTMKGGPSSSLRVV